MFSGERYHNGNEWTDDAVTITTAMTEADFSGKHLGSPGAIILAAWLSRDKGALTQLNVSNNNIGQLVLPGGWEEAKTDSDEPIFRQQGGEWAFEGPEKKALGIIALADGIKNNGALLTFTFSGDHNHSQPVTMETTMTEADFSGKYLGVSGGMMLVTFLPKCQ
jgi:hypothetical protein